MKLFRLLFKPDLATPVLALMFASAVCAVLVATRLIMDGNLRYAFLGWNLFLAWLPLIFALLLCDQHVQGGRRRWRLAGWGVTWLLFFPNAPYIFTDLTHLTNRYFPHYWTDMLMILSCALTGLMLGFVSLYIVQSVVANRYGRVMGWLFTMGVAGLSGVGVFIGRFLRFNTWDVLWRPMSLFQRAGGWVADPFGDARPYVFSTLFAVFLFIAYLMFYSLTKLPPSERIAGAKQ
ncbi:MAG: DUF1361 domain-containing protein [Verrucomicrobiae bacterium]|nr:DUF1361 domain-containing protein [Verrucomicrobiae bacterium]